MAPAVVHCALTQRRQRSLDEARSPARAVPVWRRASGRTGTGEAAPGTGWQDWGRALESICDRRVVRRMLMDQFEDLTHRQASGNLGLVAGFWQTHATVVLA